MVLKHHLVRCPSTGQSLFVARVRASELAVMAARTHAICRNESAIYSPVKLQVAGTMDLAALAPTSLIFGFASNIFTGLSVATVR